VAGPRDLAARLRDTRALLTTPGIDVWVATASSSGVPYLVPLSLAWIDGRVVIALEASSRTARNLTSTGRARLAVGPTRDVVILDVVLERSAATGEDRDLGAAYVDQADWDPRRSEGYVFLVLRPERVQAWREADEIEGRTLMRHGRWVTGGAEPR
jgi:hypothetical protein